ncbi:hypothetical protein [Yinghuangia soli]|uniref:Uncharacterized protein n=1 Tax=Yinghuangia soli TaxID=2908204 RepID=A0AA41PVA9_9ACTN|nr:hypothetical protein [Yinghuangia soli]MCF2526495.1 hypothetical protein [Yinghuangia soli]
MDGQVFGALPAEQLQDWLGPGTRLATLHFRFRELVFVGEEVRCTGRVTAIEGELVTVVQQIAVVGPDARVAVAPAGATLTVRERP